MLKRFSYSSLESFRNCPAQFKIRYIDGVRKPDEGIEAFMGKRVHETLELLYNEKKSGSIPFIDHLLDFFHSRWNEKWHGRIAITNSSLNQESYQFIGEECIARYYRNYSPFEESAVSTEMIIDFDLGDDSYPMRGVIDRLDKTSDSAMEIHDYKTGKNVMNQAAADKNEQLALYQIGVSKEYDSIESFDLVWHFLQQGIERRSTRSSFQPQWRRISTRWMKGRGKK